MADDVTKADLEPDRIAEELLKVDAAVTAVTKADGPLSPQARAQNANATRKAEAAYLEAVGGNLGAWQSAREAGRDAS